MDEGSQTRSNQSSSCRIDNRSIIPTRENVQCTSRCLVFFAERFEKMPGSDIAAMERNAAKICTADTLRAYLRPGKAFGSLRPYISATIYMEPSRTFVISSSGRDIQASSDAAAIRIFGQACGAELGNLREKNLARFNQAVDFINGVGIRDAEAFLASPK
jgi:hypothetical protein